MCVQSGNQKSTPPSAARISETDIERIGKKIRNQCNIRHRVIGCLFSLFFLDIEPADNNSEVYHIGYLKF
jgi:hypothetical protein